MTSPLLNGLLGPRPYPILNTPGLVLLHDYTRNLDVLNNRTATSALTVTRASERTATRGDGLIQTFGDNMAAINDVGLWSTLGRTNVVLHNRDLTNAAWSGGSNMTTTKNQVGVDGVSNSASSITAGAADATILQPITLGSSARFQTAYVKRLIGSGAVSMTMDGGSTWTTVTVTDDWTRVSIPTQTISNPSVGFRLATSGDSIAIDCVQNEDGAFATNPIFTAGSAVARAADRIALPAPSGWWNETAATAFLDIVAPPALFSTPVFLGISVDGSFNDSIYYSVGSGGSTFQSVLVGGVGQASALFPGLVTTAGQRLRCAFTVAANDFRNVINGTAYASDTSGSPLTGVNQAWLGSWNGGNPCNSVIKRFAVFNRALSTAEMRLITSPAFWGS